ncbi:MAG TPA: hypothetical protein VIL65_12130 [Beijerinckiaceae bacterium]
MIRSDAPDVRLDRAAVARVMESKARAEIAAARGRSGEARTLPPGPWADGMAMGEEGLGLDSLERLWLAAAFNEMTHLDAAGEAEALLDRPVWGAWLDLVEAAWTRPGAEVTFATSGSTGAPKRCTHALADLAAEVEVLADLFADRSRIAALAPAHHIYGFLFTALLPARLGVPVIDSLGLSPATLRDSLSDGDLLVSFPDRWSFLERSLARFPAGVVGATSTAPCPTWLKEALIAKGLSGLVEIYGSSETAGIGARRWPEEAYTLFPLWTPLDPSTAPAPATLVRSTGRTAVTMDRLSFSSPRQFTVTGRVDEAVQVGGVNVFPGEVAALLRRHPGVREAVVRPMRPEEGARLKAFVVPADGTALDALERGLQAFIDRELPAPARPKALAFGAVLPRTDAGKLADW